MKKRIFGFLLSLALILQIAMPGLESQAASAESQAVTLSGSAHVQTYADTPGKWDGKTLTLGTTGQAKRLEAITINFTNNTGYEGSIEYRVHRQTYGWTGWVENGSPAGTTGQAKRLEAIQIRLTGELAEHYSIRYRVHIQTYAWNQGWVYDGAVAGTEGEAKRLEALEIQLVEKNTSNTPNVAYRVHRQTYGWENVWAQNGKVSGTTGQAKRLEGITITLNNLPYSGGIEYRTHVQSHGWMPWVSNGVMSGTQGEAKRLEAIQIRLTGELAAYYDIYYRVHAESYGWLGWAKNGEEAGTAGYGKRLEAIQIVLVKKNENPPIKVDNVTSVSDTPYHDKEAETSAQPQNPSTPQNPTVPEQPTHTHIWIPVTESYYAEKLYIDGNLVLTLKADSEDYDYFYDKKEIIYAEGYSKDSRTNILLQNGSSLGTDYTYFLLEGKGMTEYEEPVIVNTYNCNSCDFVGTKAEIAAHQKTAFYPETGLSHGGWNGPVGTRVEGTIHHSVDVKSETVEIVTGYKCSCGATKQ